MLNDTQCRTAKPKAKPYKLPDGNGLYLEVKPNGAKAWRYRFKLAKDGTIKESMFAIGDYASAPNGETPKDDLNRRIDDIEIVRQEVNAWQSHRNNRQAKVKWQFTSKDARIKLARLYPTLES